MKTTPEFRVKMIYGSIGVEHVPNMPGFTRSYTIDENGVKKLGEPQHYVCLSIGGVCMYCGRITDQSEYDDARKPWWKFW